MRKKIISLVLLAFFVMTSLPVMAENDEVFVSDSFSSYAENKTGAGPMQVISGVDTRVVSDNGNKVLYSRAYGDPVKLKGEIAPSDNLSTVFSVKVKFQGKVSGKLFNITSGSNEFCFLNVRDDDTIVLDDGKKIGGTSQGIYKTFTVVANWDEQLYDVYVDKRCVAADCYMPQTGAFRNPTEYEFNIENLDENSSIFIDDLRIYAGEILPWERSFKTEVVNNEVLDFEPTTNLNTEAEVISNIDFDNGPQGVTVASMGGELGKFADEDGTKGLHFYADSKTESTTYIDVNPELGNLGKYVVDMRYRINDMGSSSNLAFFDVKDMYGSWRLGYKAYPAGNVNCEGVGKAMGTYSVGVWERFSVIYNLPAGIADVYRNGKYITSHSVPEDIYPILFRIDFKNSVGSSLDVDIDWIRVYTGKELKDDSLFGGSDMNEGGSIMDPKSQLDAALKDKTVFMVTNDTVYFEGEKKSVALEQYKPYAIDDDVMIPENMVSLLGDKKVTFTPVDGKILIGDGATFKLNDKKATINGKEVELSEAPVLKNNCLYLPLRDITEKIYNNVYTWNNRGFAVVGKEAVPPISDWYFIDRFIKWQPSNLIYRYMQFDNPTGMEIIEELRKNHPNKSHPRILYTNEDIEFILNKVDTEPEMKEAYDVVIAQAKAYLIQDFSSWAKADSNTRLSTIDDCQDVIFTLSQAHLLTGEAKYAEKGVEIMRYVASWETLDVQVSNLISGHWAAVMALGYDSFYNYMNATKEGKDDIQYFKDRVRALTFKDHIDKYLGGVGPDWVTIQDNFLGVIGGGLLALGLAMGDEEDVSEDAAIILENVIKSLEICVSLFYPNGGYYEGNGYILYCLENFMIGLDGLFNCCKTDYGLGSAKGFTDAGDMITYTTSVNMSLGYHDGTSAGSNTDGIVRGFFAYRYNKPTNAVVARRQSVLRGTKQPLQSLFYYYRAIEGKENEIDLSQVPLDHYLYGCESGSFINSREISDPVFAGFHGGWTNLPHDSLDLGEFVFESNNVKWALDLGPDSYNLPGYFAPSGYRIYRKRPEGENCLVINPSVDAQTYYGQKLGSAAKLIDFEGNKPFGAKAAYDLTEAYERDAEKYIRGYYFGDNRNTLTIQDEVSLKGNSELYWFMHTGENIQVIDKNKVKLKSKDGKYTLTAEAYCNIPDYEVVEMAAAPLPDSPIVEGQADNKGYRKLAIHVPNANGDVVIAVKLMPDNNIYQRTPLKVTPISNWTIPDEFTTYRRPVFKEITVDGKLIKRFMPGSIFYNISLPFGTEKIPQVAAKSEEGEVSVKQAESVNDKAIITLKGKNGETLECEVSFNVNNDRPINVTEEIQEAEMKTDVSAQFIMPKAAFSQTLPEADNGPDKMIDNNFDTSCAQDAREAWYEVDLGEVMDISGTALAFYSGSLRYSMFDIMYSEDGTNFKRVFTGRSTGTTDGFEYLPIPGRVRYIRYIGRGNSTSTWNNITEFRAYR